MFTSFAKKLLLATPFAAVIVTPSLFYPYVTGKIFLFRAIVELATLLTVMGWARGETLTFTPFKHPLAKAVLAFFVTLFIGLSAGIDPWFSFWSSFERSEGFVQTIHYGLFFSLLLLLFRDASSWKKMFISSLIAGTFSVIALPLAIGNFSAEGFGLLIKDGRFIGSLGNAIYVGVYSLFMLFFAAYLFITAQKENRKRFSFFLAGIALLAVYLLAASKTRGAFLGLALGSMTAALIFIFVKNNAAPIFRKIGMATIGAMIGIGLLMAILGSALPNGTCAFCERMLTLSPSDASNQPRLWMWQSAMQAIAERPLFGWGQENFYAAFNKNFDPRHYHPENPAGSEIRVDRPHNIYLERLLDGGVLAFVAFAFIFAVALKKLLYRMRAPRTEPSIFLIAGISVALLVAYAVQGLFAVETAPVLINFFLFLSFLVLFTEEPKEGTDESGRSIRLLALITGGLSVFLLFFLSVYLPYQKARLLLRSQHVFVSAGVQPQAFYDTVGRAMRTPSPVSGREATFEYLMHLANLASSQTDPKSVDFLITVAEEHIAPLLDGSEREERFGHNIAEMGALYKIAYTKTGNEAYFAKSKEYLLRTLRYNPRHPAALYNLANLYTDKGETEKAQELIRQIKGLWPEDQTFSEAEKE